MSKKLMVIFLMVSFGVLLTVSLALAQPDSVRVAISAEPVAMDPNIDIGGFGMPVQRAIYEPLVKLDYDLEYVPWLAESWEKVDDKTWQFNLREGIKFHSGNSFNAEAVKMFFDSVLDPEDPGAQKPYVDMIKEVVVIDEYTVEFQLKFADGTFLDQLCRIHLHITDAKERERLGEKFGHNPSGTGPFKLTKWDHGNALYMEKNPDYWRNTVMVEGLEFHIIPEATTRVMLIERGDIDIAFWIPHELFGRLDANPDVDALSISTMRPCTYLLNMNPEHPILSDENVRRAIAHAINTKEIAEYIMGAAGEYLPGFVDPVVFGGIEMPYEYNPEFSQKLLEQSGWEKNSDGFYEKDGKTLTLHATHPVHWVAQRDLAEGLQMQLREVGIDLRIELVEVAVYRERMFGAVYGFETGEMPKFDMLFLGTGQRTRDAEAILQHMYCPWGELPVGQYNNLEFQKLVRMGMYPYPEHIRRQAYNEAQKILYADVAGIPLYLENWLGARHRRVEGYKPHPMEEPYWENLKIVEWN